MKTILQLKIFSFFTFFLIINQGIYGQSGLGNGNKKINLDDVKIKGEVNQGQNLMSRKTHLNLDSRITIPTNFRNAILENLDPELYGLTPSEQKK